MMVKRIVKWTDKQMEKAYAEEGPKSYARAFMAGAVEGFVDTAVVAGAVLSAYGWYLIVKGHKPEN